MKESRRGFLKALGFAGAATTLVSVPSIVLPKDVDSPAEIVSNDLEANLKLKLVPQGGFRGYPEEDLVLARWETDPDSNIKHCVFEPISWNIKEMGTFSGVQVLNSKIQRTAPFSSPITMLSGETLTVRYQADVKDGTILN